MGRRRDKLQGSRRRQVLQLEDNDGRDSFLAQYGYNSRYGEEEEEDMNEAPMFRQHGHLYDDNMDCDSDERNPDAEDDGKPSIEFKTNGGKHSEGPQEGKKIDSELANFMAEIEAISSAAPPTLDDQEGDGQDVTERATPDKESTPELPEKPETKPTAKPADSDIVHLEEPVTCWQQCLDENTECYYYWHVETNEVTWEIPPDFTQYLLQVKAFEEKVLALEQAGKTVKVTGCGTSCDAGSAGSGLTGDKDGEEAKLYGPFLPEKPSEDSAKPVSVEASKGSNSSVSVKIMGSGKLLSADYYDSDDGSEDEADKHTKTTTPAAESEDDDLDFDIDDIDRELELALERKQAEVKASSKSAESEKFEISTKTDNSNADEAQVAPSLTCQNEHVSLEDKVQDSVNVPEKVTPETIIPEAVSVIEQNIVSSVDKPRENLKDVNKLSTHSSKLLSDFKADNEEKDRNFKKLIELKDDRSTLERRERKIEDGHERKNEDRHERKNEDRHDRKSEDRHERKGSREEKRSSKDERRSDRKSDRKEDRKSEHKEKKKKDDRKEDKKSHRHKHSKGEGSSREKSKHSYDHKRVLSDQEDGDSDDHRSHRKRSKHKHKDKDRSLSNVVTAEPRPATPTDVLPRKDVLPQEDMLPPKDVLPPKPDPTPAQGKDEDKTLKETIVEISETVFGKLQFLEVVKEGLSGLQMLLISLETRIQDWEAGGLSNQYLLKKLQDASDQLLKYEDSAAPPGWSTHWDRSYRRYFYTNAVTGDSQWDYPDLDTEAPTRAQDIMEPRVPKDGEAAVSNREKDRGIKEKTGDSKPDTNKVTRPVDKSELEELQPLVHPGEPPPPGTETPGVSDVGQAPMDEGSYEVSPAHSIDLEEMEDVEEEGDKAPSEPTDVAVISRPPLLLGPESGDPAPPNHAPPNSLHASLQSDEAPNPALPLPEGSASNSVPDVTPSAEVDRAGPDSNSSHHRDKEKKKKKDKSISSSSLSLKKKKVSSLVQKWQQVQQEVEREEKSSKERESYLHRYSP